MSKLKYKVGVLGAGNMGEAFVGAMIRSKIADPTMIMISDVRGERLEFMRSTYDVVTVSENFKLFSECAIVILAVKPQQTEEVLLQISNHPGYAIPERKLFISIAAGIPISKMEKWLYEPLDQNSRQKLPVVRVMPNTPALVLAGMSGMSANKNATPEDVDLTLRILSALGRVIEFKETALDAVTALSGSGPAYVFYFIESMIEGGLATGLDRHAAKTLTLETFKGALKLLEEREETPEALRQKVTSPGGTTEAALKVMEGTGVKQNIVAAIETAAKRSKELSA